MAQSTSKRSLTRILSLLIAVICMVVSIACIKAGKEEPVFGLGDYSGVSVQEQTAQYLSDQSNESLVELLKVLCYRAVVEKDETAQPLIVQYGTLLYDLARSGEADLSTLGSDETMLELLGYLKEYGAQ